jgi:hypothetical protein
VDAIDGGVEAAFAFGEVAQVDEQDDGLVVAFRLPGGNQA